ncbi:hypothetical protein ASC80_04920 [Afipia sp. Root123D2]|uniref:YdcF family protein n=1 Tax=Afipia sp. Root123D2 TaxID=1736436 RepID=UPI0006FB86D8|nr:YdcF family protein [Afipia sp. Root123D2]KQW22698.1 hypothetical protein ASC80_04920 [Afipia sp. Root123D2]
MFFVLSKVLGFVTTPSNVIGLICLAGVLLLATRWRACAVRVMAVGIVLALVVGYSPLGEVMTLALSERFPAWQDNGRTPTGVIVLGGAINPEVSAARGTPELNTAVDRLTATADLARRFPSAKIVFTGGSGNLIDRSLPEAQFAVPVLEDLGIARGRLIVEDRSRTTFENAAFTRSLVDPKPGELWLLVTSAGHMPRAIGSFRAAGFEVEAYPVDWHSRGWIDAATPFETLSWGLGRTDVAMHEWIGLVAYWLTGRSSELFPGPKAKS